MRECWLEHGAEEQGLLHRLLLHKNNSFASFALSKLPNAQPPAFSPTLCSSLTTWQSVSTATEENEEWVAYDGEMLGGGETTTLNQPKRGAAAAAVISLHRGRGAYLFLPRDDGHISIRSSGPFFASFLVLLRNKLWSLRRISAQRNDFSCKILSSLHNSRDNELLFKCESFQHFLLFQLSSFAAYTRISSSSGQYIKLVIFNLSWTAIFKTVKIYGVSVLFGRWFAS